MAFTDENYPSTELDEQDLTPHSIEAEQALLGALLYDNEVYHRISAIVQAKHFYNPVHIRIYESISTLIEHGKLADAIVLKNRFSQDETLVDIGGVEYLALLLESAPAGASAPEYAKMIFDLALRRDLIRLGGDIKTLAEDPDSEQDATSQISAAEMQFFSLAETGAVSSGFISFDKALLESIEMTTAA
ncbi:MAG: replicative DNA helicase, partial [Robiginitomaculum sp.]|nr:replicative DNA helicase [Robiginitomaculum sp.]